MRSVSRVDRDILSLSDRQDKQHHFGAHFIANDLFISVVRGWAKREGERRKLFESKLILCVLCQTIFSRANFVAIRWRKCSFKGTHGKKFAVLSKIISSLDKIFLPLKYLFKFVSQLIEHTHSKGGGAGDERFCRLEGKRRKLMWTNRKTNTD